MSPKQMFTQKRKGGKQRNRTVRKKRGRRVCSCTKTDEKGGVHSACWVGNSMQETVRARKRKERHYQLFTKTANIENKTRLRIQGRKG